MSVIRIHKTKNFTVMSNYHFKEKKMSLKAKGLLSLMLSLPDDWNYSISGLVALSKDGKDSVMTALAELEKFGYLSRSQLVNERGQFSGVEYHIFEQPQQEIPIAENPNADKQKAEKQNAENPQLLNTIPIKDLKNKDINISSTNVVADNLIEILLTIEDHELRELYHDYILWRSETDAPLTERGLKMLIARCERLSDFDTATQRAMIETALIQGWKNVFKPKEEELVGRNALAEEHKKILFGD